ncbi:MAG: hypothetical protein ABSC48_10015 [Terracidiphilus sp.]
MAEVEAIARRIRIGVTGHRRLDDPEAVKALVKKAIEAEAGKLFAEEPQGKIERGERAAAVSFCVVSALAEGADRVVARAVLEYPDARLEAVLPLAVEDYLEDFASEESRKEFWELLGRCEKPVLLRRRSVEEESGDANEQLELRRDAYAEAGRYVVDHCDVLIAVWDGEPARGRGGTAEIVQYAMEQRRPVIRVWGGSFEALKSGGAGG